MSYHLDLTEPVWSLYASISINDISSWLDFPALYDRSCQYPGAYLCNEAIYCSTSVSQSLLLRFGYQVAPLTGPSQNTIWAGICVEWICRYMRRMAPPLEPAKRNLLFTAVSSLSIPQIQLASTSLSIIKANSASMDRLLNIAMTFCSMMMAVASLGSIKSASHQREIVC